MVVMSSPQPGSESPSSELSLSSASLDSYDIAKISLDYIPGRDSTTAVAPHSGSIGVDTDNSEGSKSNESAVNASMSAHSKIS